MLGEIRLSTVVIALRLRGDAQGARRLVAGVVLRLDGDLHRRALLLGDRLAQAGELGLGQAPLHRLARARGEAGHDRLERDALAGAARDRRARLAGAGDLHADGLLGEQPLGLRARERQAHDGVGRVGRGPRAVRARLGQRVDGLAVGDRGVERAPIGDRRVGVRAAVDRVGLAVADLDAVRAGARVDGVSPRAADEAVREGGPGQRVCERRADRVLDGLELVVLRAERASEREVDVDRAGRLGVADRVGPGLAADVVRAAATVERVVAGIAEQQVRRSISGDGVAERGADDGLDLGDRVAALAGVLGGRAAEVDVHARRRAVLEDDAVVARAALERVVAAPAADLVVAAEAEHGVVAVACVDHVARRDVAALDLIVALAGSDVDRARRRQRRARPVAALEADAVLLAAAVDADLVELHTDEVGVVVEAPVGAVVAELVLERAVVAADAERVAAALHVGVPLDLAAGRVLLAGREQGRLGD